MASYVYLRSEPGLFTVGYLDGANKWVPESDHPTAEGAARRAHWLNGGADAEQVAAFSSIAHHAKWLRERLAAADYQIHNALACITNTAEAALRKVEG